MKYFETCLKLFKNILHVKSICRDYGNELMYTTTRDSFLKEGHIDMFMNLFIIRIQHKQELKITHLV